MKLSNSFFYTLRENVKDEESISSNLLVKAGMIKKSSSGIYMIMPMGLKVKNKIEKIIRDEMNKTGALELSMPSLILNEIYEQSGRRNSFGEDMFSLKDRYNRDYVLGPTHEELFVQAASTKIKSYRDMPFNLYQFQTKFRDETRPRYGLIRTREFTMKDAYSFDADLKGLDKSYQAMYHAYNNSFDRMNLNYKIVKADTGAMGGILSEEYQAISDIGEDTVIYCDNCSFASNIEIAPVTPIALPKEKLKTKELIETPNIKTIDEICQFLNISIAKTVKTLVYNVDGKILMFLVKGNREINETKVLKLLNATEITLATNEELKTITDAEFGSLGPVDTKASIIMDNEIKEMCNFVVGANKTGYHYINANLNDFKTFKTGDIVNISSTDKCPLCGSKLHFNKGIEIGNLFKLGTKYCESLNLNYLDKNNESKPVVMGSYGIGTARCMAAIVEQHNDEKGIIWPISVAPFKVGIILINNKDEDIANVIYNELNENNIETLLDDRNERPGVKFNDLDLIGIPFRIVIGKKIKDNIVEFKSRDNKINKEIKINEIINTIKKLIK